jgi:hypothetical protein
MIELLFVSAILTSASSISLGCCPPKEPVVHGWTQNLKSAEFKRRDRTERRERRSERRESRFERRESRPERDYRSDSRSYRSSRENGDRSSEYRPYDYTMRERRAPDRSGPSTYNLHSRNRASESRYDSGRTDRSRSSPSQNRNAARRETRPYEYTIRERRAADRSGSSRYDLHSRNQASGSRYDSERSDRSRSSSSRSEAAGRNDRPYEYTIRERRAPDRSGPSSYVLRSRNQPSESSSRIESPRYDLRGNYPRRNSGTGSARAASTAATRAAPRSQSTVCRGYTGTQRTNCLQAEVRRGQAEIDRINRNNRTWDIAIREVCRARSALGYAEGATQIARATAARLGSAVVRRELALQAGGMGVEAATGIPTSVSGLAAYATDYALRNPNACARRAG